MHHKELLRTTLGTITQRGEEYGDVASSFTRAAVVASTILGKRMTAYDISVVMMSIKMSRLNNQPDHQDSWVDLIAYAAFAAQFSHSRNDPAGDPLLAQVEEHLQEWLDENPESLAKAIG